MDALGDGKRICQARSSFEKPVVLFCGSSTLQKRADLPGWGQKDVADADGHGRRHRHGQRKEGQADGTPSVSDVGGPQIPDSQDHADQYGKYFGSRDGRTRDRHRQSKRSYEQQELQKSPDTELLIGKIDEPFKDLHHVLIPPVFRADSVH